MPEKSGLEATPRASLPSTAGGAVCAQAGGKIIDTVATKENFANKRKSRRCTFIPASIVAEL
jgi:hypothetical protein